MSHGLNADGTRIVSVFRPRFIRGRAAFVCFVYFVVSPHVPFPMFLYYMTASAYRPRHCWHGSRQMAPRTLPAPTKGAIPDAIPSGFLSGSWVRSKSILSAS
jgi:hypothetical protein